MYEKVRPDFNLASRFPAGYRAAVFPFPYPASWKESFPSRNLSNQIACE